MEKNPLTRRNLATILMGTLYDPLQIFPPYQKNVNLIYRDLTRKLHMKNAGPQWDEPFDSDIKERVLHDLSFFFLIEEIQFPRKILYMNAASIKIKILFHGSKPCIGVCVVIQNTLPNGQVIIRFLCNKSRLC